MLLRSSYPVFVQPGSGWRVLLGGLVVATGLVTYDTPGFAQTPIPPNVRSGSANAVLTPASAATALVLPTSFASPEWSALSPAQKTALKPLATSWINLSDAQKRKWLSLSANFPQLPVAEQTKLHERMVQWAALSPRQREQARLNFADTKQVDPQKKNEQWQAYQALSPEEKQKLAKSAQPQPPRTALAAQPVASDKINRLPLAKSPSSVGSLSGSTLLTRPKPPVPPMLPIPPASVVIIDGVAPQ